jgi:6-phosphogluconolactonase
VEIRVEENPAEVVAGMLVDAASAGGDVVLTGGSTPKLAYEIASRAGADWSNATVWFSDERCVPPESGLSNFRMANEALLSRATGSTVHRMKGELGPVEGAADYEREYEAAGEPVFDLILLGMGPDAHTCSLFPGDDAVAERDRPVVGVETPGMAPLVSRITLTLPVVNAARSLVFLVTGEDKAEAVARAFAAPPDPRAPGSLVEPVSGTLELICDAKAAARL